MILRALHAQFSLGDPAPSDTKKAEQRFAFAWRGLRSCPVKPDSLEAQHPRAGELDSSCYTYEDHLADMGNTPSSEGAASAGPAPMETEQHGIGRMAAITGAKTAQETRTKPRGPKASGTDLPFIQVCVCVFAEMRLLGVCRSLARASG